jgi:hypothetical protein
MLFAEVVSCDTSHCRAACCANQCAGDSAEGISSTAIPLSTAAQAQVKAVIMMGNPRYEYGFSYEVGTCKAGGVGLYSTLDAVVMVDFISVRRTAS